MNKTKAVHMNGSPRKKWNTAKVLESAQEAGAECETVNLYDIDFKGLQPAIAYCKEHGYKWY